MKKLAVVMLFALALAGCETTQQVVTTTRLQVVDVPANLYNCPVIKTFPEVKTLTDVQVGRLIVQLEKNNVTCRNSLDAIRSYLAAAKKTVGGN